MTPALKVAAAVVTAAVLGLRHGVDYDHVAAILDLTGAARSSRRRAFGLAVLYGLGHSLIVATLGAGAVAFGMVLPTGLEHVMQVLVGITLIALGAVLLYGVMRRPGAARMLSRWQLLREGVRWLAGRLGRFQAGADTAHTASWAPGPGSAFAVGIIHGIGGETPTQLGLFALAAGVGGWPAGMLCLAGFAAGVLAIAALMGAFSASLTQLLARRQAWLRTAMAGAGTYSVLIGILFTTSAAG